MAKVKVQQDNIIELRGVKKIYDDVTVADVNFAIKRGEFVTLLGPSGCGKTTTLRMIAGFEKPTEGQVLINGKDVTDTPPHKRPVNTVFQKYALFPHLNVYNNIAFGLKLKYVKDCEAKNKLGENCDVYRKLTKAEIDEKVKNVLRLVDLEDYGHRNVASLSGGQQQRVAIARAIVNEPEVLLLDEPLGALDLKMRKDMQIELMSMHKKLGITFVYVTHDQEEALTMSDTIVVMRGGEIQQIGTPQKVYDEPANAFVADFIGESNIFSGIMREDFVVELAGRNFECVDKGFKKNEPVDIIIRPEDIKIVKPESTKRTFEGVVETCVFKGDHFETTVLMNDFEFLVHDNVECKVGDNVTCYIKPFDFHIMAKSRIINKIDTYMWDEGVVEICGGRFPCNSTLPSDTPVSVEIGFKDVEVFDDEEDGIIGGEVINSIYKGNYYQCIIRTDDHYDFFVDTTDEWLKGDRVGISVAPEKMSVVEREEKEDE